MLSGCKGVPHSIDLDSSVYGIWQLMRGQRQKKKPLSLPWGSKSDSCTGGPYFYRRKSQSTLVLKTGYPTVTFTTHFGDPSQGFRSLVQKKEEEKEHPNLTPILLISLVEHGVPPSTTLSHVLSRLSFSDPRTTRTLVVWLTPDERT